MHIKLDLSKFKKIKSDEKTTTLRDPETKHEFRIAHNSLHPALKKKIHALPMTLGHSEAKFAGGGDVDPDAGAYGKSATQARQSAPKPSEEGSQASPVGPEEPKVDKSRGRTLGARIGYPGADQTAPINKAEGGDVSAPAPQGAPQIDPEWAKKFKKGAGFASGGKVEVEPLNPPIGKHRAPEVEPIEEMPPKKSKIVIEAIPEGGEQYANGGDVPPDDKSGQDIDYSKLIPPSNEPSPDAPPTPINTSPDAQGMAPGPAQATPTPDEAQTPPPGPPSASQTAPEEAPDYLKGYKQNAKGIQMEADAKAANAQADAKVLGAKVQEMTKMKTHYDAALDENTRERLALTQDIKDGHIDPNHLLGSQDTMQRAGTVIGLLLGGLGGGGQGNQALSFLNNQIDRDIDAQKANLGKKQSLLSANMQQFHNLQDAENMTRMQMNDMFATRLQESAATSTSPLVQARAQQALGALQQQTAPMAIQMATRQALMKASSEGGGSLNSMDPAQLVQHVVPAPHQAAVFKEIQAAQDTKRMSGAIMNAFEQAAQENTVLKTGFGLLRTPASVYALHQAMQPTFKDLEGTVRQAAMDNTFKNITPQPGDSAHTIQTKRAALHDYLQSKASAPVAKGFGIDLNMFESTRPSAAGGPTKVVNGITYTRGPNGEAIRVQ